MGALHVHEFMSVDGVIDTPTWTVDYEFLVYLNYRPQPR
jgi:hypothetical protein